MCTLLSDYDYVVSLAVSMAKATTREKIREVTWLPFTLLYDQMVRRKEIDPLSSLPIERKREYWNLTEGKQYKKIFVCQALYIYDLITETP